ARLEPLAREEIKDFRQAVKELDGWLLQRAKNETGGLISNGVDVTKDGVAKSFYFKAWYPIVQASLVPQPDRMLGVAAGIGPLHLSAPATGGAIGEPSGAGPWRDVAPSPDGRYLAAVSGANQLIIFAAKDLTPLLRLFVNGQDWIVWTREGYYAATPGAE